jgi:hypothetical protein
MEEVVAHLFSLIFRSLQSSEADYLVPEQFSFCGVRLLVSRSTPNLKDQVSLFVWLLPLDLSGMDAPTSSYATAGIALRVSGALKPHHHDKVETQSVWENRIQRPDFSNTVMSSIKAENFFNS